MNNDRSKSAEARDRENANRRPRAAGKIPAVVYGGGKDRVPVEVDRKTLLDLMKWASARTRSSCSSSATPRSGTR